MPLDAAQIGAFRAQGYSYACAMCERLHEGLRRGVDGCTGSRCAGPMAGGDFPEYQGPLTHDMMARICFVCGQDAAFRLKPKTSHVTKTLGICQDHQGLLGAMKPRDNDAPPVEARFAR